MTDLPLVPNSPLTAPHQAAVSSNDRSLVALTSGAVSMPKALHSPMADRIIAIVEQARNSLGTESDGTIMTPAIRTTIIPLLGDCGRIEVCRVREDPTVRSIMMTLISDSPTQVYTSARVALFIVPSQYGIDGLHKLFEQCHAKHETVYPISICLELCREFIYFKIPLPYKLDEGIKKDEDPWLSAVDYESRANDPAGNITYIKSDEIVAQIREALPSIDLKTYADRERQRHAIFEKYILEHERMEYKEVFGKAPNNEPK